jgi:predicted metal-dependent hydrolase
MEGFGFQVEVLRTGRKKSASIQLDGELVKVSVPQTLSDKRVRELITQRTPWIKTKLRELSERPEFKPKEYVSGETFPYLGKNYRLKVVQGDDCLVRLKNGRFIATISNSDDPQSLVKELMSEWYQNQAEMRLREKTERLAKVVDVAPRSLAIKTYKSRWGSCSARGDITYNWKIILAPHRIVDYVVVHELCHLLEHNHSARYWKHVERYVPNWRDCKDWLHKNAVSFDF